MGSKKSIALCASISHYRKLALAAKELKKRGYKVFIPLTAKRMEQSGNYNETNYKTWFKNEKLYPLKRKLMDNHFQKIKKADAILVVNEEKKGIKGYVGGNVLMEISVAYFLKKPIFLLNPIDSKNPFLEELKAINCIILNNNISRISL